MGTIEEIGVILEHMYYNVDSPCEKIFLIGDFYFPLIKLTENMMNYGLIDKRIIDRIIYLPLNSDINFDDYSNKIMELVLS